MRIFKILTSRRLLSAGLPSQRTSERTREMISACYGTTVDKMEIDHHSKLADVWWTTAGDMRALHAFNPLRVQLIVDGLANLGIKSGKPFASLDGVKLADVGCGGGILSEALARVGADVTGIDASEDLIKLARAHADTDPRISDKINYVKIPVEDFAPANEGSFDAVVTSEVLEHVADPKLFIENCVKILKPGGSIFITTVNRTFASWFFGIIVAENVLRCIPKGTHEWRKFLSPEETQRLVEACDCRTKLVHGIIYNPMINTWRWSKSSSISYALHAVKSKKQS